MSTTTFTSRLERLQNQVQQHSTRQQEIKEKLVKYGSIMPHAALMGYQREFRELDRFIKRLVNEIDFLNSQFI